MSYFSRAARPGKSRSGKALAVRLGAALAFGAALAGCQDNTQVSSARAWRPISSEMMALMTNKGVDSHAPILIRTYKKEAEFEIWKMKADGRYVHLKTFPMCRWSGQLGPKVTEGDRQVPEGFYTITPGQMNPNSNYYLSFNVGYPNAYDKAWGHTGGSIMVHGACSSAGCFSMTDEQIADIYAVAREAFGGGQRAIQMESFPFRMNVENLAKHRLDPNIGFWKQLKEGSDHFEVTKTEPKVGVCAKKYVFDAANVDNSDPAGLCPALKVDPDVRALVTEKQEKDDAKVAELVEKGVRPVRVVYADGGQHPDFANRGGDVSRPDAIAQGPTEIALDEGKIKSPLLKLAAAKAAKTKSNALIAAAKSDAAKTENVSVAEKSEPAAVPAAVAAAPERAKTSGITSWLGLSKEKDESQEPAASPLLEPVNPAPADAPLPPRRTSAGTKPQSLDHKASLDRKAADLVARSKSSANSDLVALAPAQK